MSLTAKPSPRRPPHHESLHASLAMTLATGCCQLPVLRLLTPPPVTTITARLRLRAAVRLGRCWAERRNTSPDQPEPNLAPAPGQQGRAALLTRFGFAPIRGSNPRASAPCGCPGPFGVRARGPMSADKSGCGCIRFGPVRSVLVEARDQDHRTSGAQLDGSACDVRR